MFLRERAETALEDPQAQLERALIDEFLQKYGCNLATVDLKPPAERRSLLRQASLFAAVRLAEIDARAAYVHVLHGEGRRS
jgi:hypothetical protein